MDYVASPVNQSSERIRALTSHHFVLVDTGLEGSVNMCCITVSTAASCALSSQVSLERSVNMCCITVSSEQVVHNVHR